MAEPNRYGASVETLLRVFAVLVGLALGNFIGRFYDPGCPLYPGSRVRWFLFVALVCLLLRYFMGAANHLKATYEERQPETNANAFFLKDVAFLVVFGALTVQISQSCTMSHFILSSSRLLGVAFLWALVDPLFHIAFAQRSPRTSFWKWWLWVNLLQLVPTLTIYWAYRKWSQTQRPLGKWLAISLAVGYLIFFVVDYLRIMDIRRTAWGGVYVGRRFRWIAIIILFTFGIELLLVSMVPRHAWASGFWRAGALFAASGIVVSDIVLWLRERSAVRTAGASRLPCG